MKSSLFGKLLLAAAITIAASPVAAEDIDIYAGNNSNAKSNVLLVLSNEANWSATASTAGCVLGTEMNSSFDGRVGGVEICGLYKAVTAIGATPSLVGKLNMGLMLYGAAPGGVFKFPAPPTNPLPTMDAAGINTLQAVLRNLTRTGDNVASGDVGGSMQEARAYYTGGLGMSGRQYVPLVSDVCGKNFVINIGIEKSGTAPSDSNANNVRNQLFSAVDASTLDSNQKTILKTPMTWSGGLTQYGSTSGSQYWGDEWTRFNNKNNGIITYTITLKSNTPNPDYIRYMQNMAEQGGGTAFVVEDGDVNGLVQALLTIFNSIQAVNSVFAAASLPISVNAQGTFLNQIYFGMFRPDGAGLPRWAGNLKQYQFEVDKSVTPPRLYMADTRVNMATGLLVPAINPARTGFFDPNAISFWTSRNDTASPDNIDPGGVIAAFGGTKGGFFINSPSGAGDGFDSPDGEVVEKGGVAQRIRLENLTNLYTTAAGTSTNPRRLYTCTTGIGSTPDCSGNSPLSDTPFALSNNDITDALLGTGGAPINVTSLTRNEATATAVTASAFIPALQIGQGVTLSGVSYPQYSGLVVVGTTPTATSFTFPLTVSPPTTGTGVFTAATPGFQAGFPKTISIARSGSDAVVTLVAHGFSVGNAVAISGAGAGFDKSPATITAVTANTFTYAITVAPGAATTLGTSRKGAGTLFTNTSVTLGVPGTGPSFSALVTVITNANHGYVDNDPIVVAGVVPADYNKNPVNIINGNNVGCPGPNGVRNRRYCYTINTTPAATATGSVNVTGTSFNLAGVTRTNSCTGGSPTPVVTVTVTTTLGHGMTGTNLLDISGGDSASALYTGSNISTTVTGTNTFTYPITTNPPCLDAAGTKQAAVGGATKTQLINWVRGADNIGDEQGPGVNGITVRPSIHGDVLHSRPAVVNYGGSIGVVVFYGSNDGTFRAINGNQTASITAGSVTVPPGGELWGFIPTEFYKTLLRQYLNSPVVKLNSTSTAILPAPQPKDYYFDGGIGVYQDIDSAGVITRTIIYPTARRGGRIMYALDVTTPSTPIFLWKKTQADLPELGQTWSTPKVALVKGYNTGGPGFTPKPVVIFGAGYDPAEDSEPPAARTMGRGIYVLDAITGTTVWQATKGAVAAGTFTCTGASCAGGLDMPYPIAADITLVDRITSDGSGLVDRIYAADLGGNIWRVDLEPSVGGNLPTNWKVTKFASVGGIIGDTTRRKIFFPPDVVQTKDFDAVLFATGDREHPTRTHQSINILNRLYMLKDTAVGPDGGTTPIVDDTTSAACVPSSATTAKTGPGGSNSCTEAVPTALHNASVVLPTTEGSFPFTAGVPYPSSLPGNGFYLNLLNARPIPQAGSAPPRFGPEIQAGEKSVNAPTTIGGNTFFGSNAPIPPDPSVCQPNLGTARGYSVNFVTGASQFVIFDGGGLPPSPVSGLVTINGETYPFLIGAGNPDPGCTGADCTSSVGAQRPPIPIAPVRSRTFWYRDIGNR